MYLVQKAKDTPNKNKLPKEWPVKANPCADDAMPPIGWEKLTQAELDALKKENQPEYDKWKEKQEAKEREREEEKKHAEEAPSKSAEEKLKVLGFTDDEIKKIMGANYYG